MHNVILDTVDKPYMYIFIFYCVLWLKIRAICYAYTQKSTRLINDKRYTSSNYFYQGEVTHTIIIMAIFPHFF